LLGEHITLDTYTNPDWSDAVKEEVLKLTEIGSYTKPVMDEDGYHIFQLVGFEEPGVRSYNEVKEYIKEVAMPDRLTAEWSKQMDIWLTDPALVTMYVENMRDVGLDTLAAEEAKQG